MVVCKHWLRGLYKKGNGCGFLHGYDVTKSPECYFHAKFGKCWTTGLGFYPPPMSFGPGLELSPRCHPMSVGRSAPAI